jgi:hypothetical protein
MHSGGVAVTNGEMKASSLFSPHITVMTAILLQIKVKK